VKSWYWELQVEEVLNFELLPIGTPLGEKANAEASTIERLATLIHDDNGIFD